MKMLPANATADEQGEAAPIHRRPGECAVMCAAVNRRVSGSRRARSSATTHHTSDDDVHEPPPARSDIGEPERHHGDAGAEPGRHRQDADRVGPAVLRHLLGGDDPDEEGERDPHRAGQRLRRRRGSPNDGAIAPRTDNSGASQATATITRRRPMRSASTAAGSAITMPTRTTAPAMPIPVLSTPKSSAAKLTVWVNSVLTNAALIEAAASRPSTSTCVGSSRSGGAHQA